MRSYVNLSILAEWANSTRKPGECLPNSIRVESGCISGGYRVEQLRQARRYDGHTDYMDLDRLLFLAVS
jgi:hypothetical protein